MARIASQGGFDTARSRPGAGSDGVRAVPPGESGRFRVDRWSFPSIVFDGVAAGEEPQLGGEPACFRDLGLDQVLASILSGREELDLAPLFHTPLRDESAVRFRHAVFRDLANADVLAVLRSFSSEMQAVRNRLAVAQRLTHELVRHGWFLQAAESYCAALRRFDQGLAELPLASDALTAFRASLGVYVASEAFGRLVTDTAAVREQLDQVRYTVYLHGRRVRVRKYAGERDYGAVVEETFARFGDPEGSHQVKSRRDSDGMDHVQVRILELVARLYPDQFRALAQYYWRHRDFLQPGLVAFARHVHFYLAFLEFVAALRKDGLSFCFPTVSATSKDTRVVDGFDLALATKLRGSPGSVVTNDFELSGPERVLVVTGPNQGGKTTFARMFGQLHHLAGVGCPVPGTEARLFLPDRVYTHFERQERVESARGKLADELVRIRDIVDAATGASVVVMNETLGSTTLEDARLLGRMLLDLLIERDVLCVYVTFIDELASHGEATVSMVAQVDATNPSVRTYRVARQPADGRAYASALAERYGLTYGRIGERLSC